ncbi:hypothetical protein IEO21_00382 [Rhodonia placenta]|uniref:Amino acid transporter transmembrane domain-containing protein n=1 Tax=Rhodonia placenta TaxID=104341 RepID=A0A8H7U7C2_9APHY|nr:hypothetical protein IEO21_00382 [Postia placenta]
MPTCRRKRVLLTEPSPELLSALKTDPIKEVYYLAQTGEIFETYETYAARMSFYRLKQFQCEVTGKSGLDYFQALESERQEARTMHSRFPDPLKAAVLKAVQWLAEDLKVSVKDSIAKDDPTKYDYTVQILDEDQQPGSGRSHERSKGKDAAKWSGTCLRVGCSMMSRDRLTFSKSILRRFIRDCVDRAPAVASPWTVKPAIAERYGVDTVMPEETRRGVESIKKGEIDKRKKVWEDKEGPATKKQKKMTAAAEEKVKALAAVAEKRERDAREKAEKLQKAKEENERLAAEKKKKKPIRYPTEDLDVVIGDREKKAGMKLKRPVPSYVSMPFGNDTTSNEAFLMTWNFLVVYGQPLHLSPFTMDEFEQALRHSIPDVPCALLAEIHATLIYNLRTVPFNRHSAAVSLIRERDEGGENDGVLGVPMGTLVSAMADVGNNWERAPLRHSEGREGWEESLVGCLKDHANFGNFPRIREILTQLLFSPESTNEPSTSSVASQPSSPVPMPLKTPADPNRRAQEYLTDSISASASSTSDDEAFQEPEEPVFEENEPEITFTREDQPYDGVVSNLQWDEDLTSGPSQVGRVQSQRFLVPGPRRQLTRASTTSIAIPTTPTPTAEERTPLLSASPVESYVVNAVDPSAAVQTTLNVQSAVSGLVARKPSQRSVRAGNTKAPTGHSTFGQTLFNAIAILLGIGMLSEPLAFAFAGWIGGTAIIISYGLITCYTAKILARIILSDPRLKSYSDIGRKAFGPQSGPWISAIFCLELFTVRSAQLNLTIEMMLGIETGPIFADDHGAKPTSQDMESAVTNTKGGRTLNHILTAVERALFTLCSVVVSIFVPEFSSMMAFLGAFSSFLLCVIGPISAKIALARRCGFWDGFLLVTGVIMAAWGTIAAFWSMQ